MDERDPDAMMRAAGFDCVRRLTEIRDRLTSVHLRDGFIFADERTTLINLQREILKPRWMTAVSANGVDG